jgi:hypothetical protein
MSYNTPVIDPRAEGRFFSDAGSVAQPWLLYKRGSDENHVALAGSGDKPLGVSPDRPKSAGDQLTVWFLGDHEGTLFGVASGAIAAGNYLVPGANGTVMALPAGAGAYYVLGEANAAAVDGQMVPIIHRFPYPPTVQ